MPAEILLGGLLLGVILWVVGGALRHLWTDLRKLAVKVEADANRITRLEALVSSASRDAVEK